MIFGPDVQAVIFDMDGVLWHSNRAHEEAYKLVFAEAGIETAFDYECAAGRRTADVMHDILDQDQQPVDSDTVKALAAAKQSAARAILQSELPLADGCQETLARLAQTKTLALASSASAASVALFLSHSRTAPLFKVVIDGDTVSAGKPLPMIYDLALQRLDIRAEAAAVVEDAPSGVRAARGAGIGLVVGIEGTVKATELEAAGANTVVGCLRDLTTTC